MDKRILLDLQKRTAETLDQIKAIALTQSRFSSDGEVLAGEIEKLESIHREILGRLSEQFHQIDYLEQRSSGSSERFELITPTSLGKNDPFGKALGSPPKPDAKPYTASVYYYWWRFLRLNSDYKACVQQGGTGQLAALYDDFGDIYAQDFEPWWHERGKELFAYKFETEADPPRVADPSEPVVAADRIAISVPLDGDTASMIAEVARLLRKEVKEYKKNHPKLAPKYEPEDRYKIHALHNKAIIYEAIEVEFRGQGQLDILEKIRPRLSIQSNNLEDEPQKRRFMSGEYNDAKAIVANVVMGRFPVFRLNAKAAKHQSALRAARSDTTSP